VSQIFLFITEISLASWTDQGHNGVLGTTCSDFRWFRFLWLRREHIWAWHLTCSMWWRWSCDETGYDVIVCYVTWRTSDLDIQTINIVAKFSSDLRHFPGISAVCLLIYSFIITPWAYTQIQSLNKKLQLSQRGRAMLRVVKILISHSRSFKVIQNYTDEYRACVMSY